MWEKWYPSKLLVSFKSIVNYSDWAACHLSLPIILYEGFMCVWQHAESYSTAAKQQHSTSRSGAKVLNDNILQTVKTLNFNYHSEVYWVYFVCLCPLFANLFIGHPSIHTQSPPRIPWNNFTLFKEGFTDTSVPIQFVT